MVVLTGGHVAGTQPSTHRTEPYRSRNGPRRGNGTKMRWRRQGSRPVGRAEYSMANTETDEEEAGPPPHTKAEMRSWLAVASPTGPGLVLFYSSRHQACTCCPSREQWGLSTCRRMAKLYGDSCPWSGRVSARQRSGVRITFGRRLEGVLFVVNDGRDRQVTSPCSYPAASLRDRASHPRRQPSALRR